MGNCINCNGAYDKSSCPICKDYVPLSEYDYVNAFLGEPPNGNQYSDNRGDSHGYHITRPNFGNHAVAETIDCPLCLRRHSGRCNT